MSPAPRNTTGHVKAPTSPPSGPRDHVTMSTEPARRVTLVVYLDNGQVLRFPVESWTVRTSSLTGDLKQLGWETPSGPGLRALHIDCDHVVAVMEEP